MDGSVSLRSGGGLGTKLELWARNGAISEMELLRMFMDDGRVDASSMRGTASGGLAWSFGRGAGCGCADCSCSGGVDALGTGAASGLADTISSDTDGSWGMVRSRRGKRS